MLESEKIREIAALARIGLSDKEVEHYQEELSQVVDFFHTLDTLAADSVQAEPFSEAPLLRTDIAEPASLSVREGILKNSPTDEDGALKVSSVFDTEKL